MSSGMFSPVRRSRKGQGSQRLEFMITMNVMLLNSILACKHTPTCTRKHTPTCTCKHTHKCTHAHIQTHTCTHTNTHTIHDTNIHTYINFGSVIHTINSFLLFSYHSLVLIYNATRDRYGWSLCFFFFFYLSLCPPPPLRLATLPSLALLL